jgi:hypothetical protein
MQLTIRPLTPDLWPALEDLFGKGGASNGCWCMYSRIGSEYHKREREKNRRAFRKIVKHGPPPGLLAFDGERAVGWCQLTPRDDLPWLNRARPFQRVDDVPVWSQSMKPTAPLRNKFCMFATTSCRGLSLSRWASSQQGAIVGWHA